MRATLARATAFVALVVAPIAGIARTPEARTATPAAQHVLLPPAKITWGPAPPGLPPGAQMAVLSGDPSKPGQFTVSTKFPDGYTVPPHWHPTAENVIVVEGTMLMGMGDTFNEAATTAIGAGGYAKLPKGMHHFVRARGATTIVIFGNGPFEITYVNPKDDPRKTAKPSTN